VPPPQQDEPVDATHEEKSAITVPTSPEPDQMPLPKSSSTPRKDSVENQVPPEPPVDPPLNASTSVPPQRPFHPRPIKPSPIFPRPGNTSGYIPRKLHFKKFQKFWNLTFLGQK